MSNTPEKNNHNQYIITRRLERAVQALCNKDGIFGDPLADESRLGTEAQEWKIKDIVLDLPWNLKMHSLAERMVRSCVLTHEPQRDTQTKSRYVPRDIPRRDER